MYLVPHFQDFLWVCVERHKLVWVFNSDWHATAGFLHVVRFHPLESRGGGGKQTKAV